MATEKQITANRENAKLGGVKTDEGKTVSRWNAMRHGILKEVVSDYEQESYEDIVEQLIERFRPEDALECVLVDRIAICRLRLHRVARAENEYMRSVLNPRKVTIESFMPEFNFNKETVVKEGYVPIVSQEAVEKLSNVYLRYETAIENRMYKAIHELERLQAARRGEVVPIPLAIEVNASGE